MTRRNRSVRTMEGQNKRQAFLNGNLSRQPPIRQSGEFLKDSITFVTKSYKVEKPQMIKPLQPNFEEIKIEDTMILEEPQPKKI